MALAAASDDAEYTTGEWAAWLAARIGYALRRAQHADNRDKLKHVFKHGDVLLQALGEVVRPREDCTFHQNLAKASPGTQDLTRLLVSLAVPRETAPSSVGVDLQIRPMRQRRQGEATEPDRDVESKGCYDATEADIDGENKLHVQNALCHTAFRPGLIAVGAAPVEQGSVDSSACDGTHL